MLKFIIQRFIHSVFLEYKIRLKLFAYHLWCNLANYAGNGFTISTIVSHLEFNCIADFKVLDGSAELAKVEEQPSLSFTALYEPV